MTRLMVTADLHIDSYGSRIDPATGLSARLVDYLTTVRWVAQLARDRGCEALIVAGDFSERRHINEWLVRHIQDALSDGPKRQIFVRGNHDSLVAGESIVSVLEEMGPDWTGHNATGIDRVGEVAVCSIAHVDRHWLRTQPGFEDVPEAQVYQALAEQFLVIARGLYAEVTKRWPSATPILICHQTLAGGQMSDTQAAFFGEQQVVVDAHALAAIGFGAVIAGHLHRAQMVVDDPRCPVLYAGSVERVDFGEEHEEKSVVLLEMIDGAVTFERIPTPARRFVTLRGTDAIPMHQVEGAIVRCIDVPVDVDTAQLRKDLEAEGAFEITEIRVAPVDAPAIAGGLSEALSAEEALTSYFAEDPDAPALVERGRAILAEVAS